ncbi:OVARIAN TUMOR DOMAIN-containing deubiquitinating enzyme 4 isoform X3 [Eucalyptus grandis]|uniref:OVARIAN TUMOR DOMAIN-containing deubiquitinating enzyme 4 isoform X3 n=1 Tax=Eucalyptus grandis TaxID=71139 RepID=UPI0005278078|nr:OVARIAN TUMOR DOMAIN-containing deubiquitinating enzyme 4 isoform X3 [Eucalyptus grandis]
MPTSQSQLLEPGPHAFNHPQVERAPHFLFPSLSRTSRGARVSFYDDPLIECGLSHPERCRKLKTRVVADEFVKRRAEIERFLEDDFDTYVAEMRQPHQWGGEPELLMCSHVLQTPITVYMKERFSSSLRIIAEYGREYGTGNPINVLYHSYGHYDALLPPNGNGQYKMSNKR